MRITIEDLTFDDLSEDGDGWRIDLKRLLREAVEAECRNVARSVATEVFAAKQAAIVTQMRAWIDSATPEELAKL